MSLDSMEIAVADVDEFWYGKPCNAWSFFLGTCFIVLENCVKVIITDYSH
jgi:hypothetical protein